MLNKLRVFMEQYRMVSPGEQVVCAISGGADSVALLWGLYLLKDSLQFTLCAAHFNHNLRGEESRRDENFVRDLCDRYDIPLAVGSGQVKPGKKGLEAAARDARYGFLQSLPGKIATAHTADDNAETVLMHLVRGTGLKGLGAIAPVNGRLIRPMLGITRQEVLEFLREYHLSYVDDSSNFTDTFLRNRIRRQIMPVFREENPSAAENLSAMALRLRQDEQALTELAQSQMTCQVERLREMAPALRSRVLAQLLITWGVREPESQHIVLLEQLVFSDKPSARASFPGHITVGRNYSSLEKQEIPQELPPVMLACPGITEIPRMGIRVTCCRGTEGSGIPLCVQGQLYVRSRRSGDEIRLPGGTKSLKKLFIDKKIPASRRSRIPVICDDLGILAVEGVGWNRERQGKPVITLMIEHTNQPEG